MVGLKEKNHMQVGKAAFCVRIRPWWDWKNMAKHTQNPSNYELESDHGGIESLYNCSSPLESSHSLESDHGGIER
mgnify:CR=1 FL=1